MKFNYRFTTEKYGKDNLDKIEKALKDSNIETIRTDYGLFFDLKDHDKVIKIKNDIVQED